MDNSYMPHKEPRPRRIRERASTRWDKPTRSERRIAKELFSQVIIPKWKNEKGREEVIDNLARGIMGARNAIGGDVGVRRRLARKNSEWGKIIDRNEMRARALNEVFKRKGVSAKVEIDQSGSPHVIASDKKLERQIQSEIKKYFPYNLGGVDHNVANMGDARPHYHENRLANQVQNIIGGFRYVLNPEDYPNWKFPGRVTENKKEINRFLGDKTRKKYLIDWLVVNGKWMKRHYPHLSVSRIIQYIEQKTD